jgi:hypothetical protein
MRFTIRDVLWLTVVAAVAIALWLGWSREVATLREENVAKVVAERDKANRKTSDFAEAYRKLLIKSKLQESALERLGVKADADSYRIVPVQADSPPNSD